MTYEVILKMFDFNLCKTHVMYVYNVRTKNNYYIFVFVCRCNNRIFILCTNYKQFFFSYIKRLYYFSNL